MLKFAKNHAKLCRLFENVGSQMYCSRFFGTSCGCACLKLVRFEQSICSDISTACALYEYVHF